MQVQQSTSLCDIKYKIVFLGQMSVGKTCIIERFIRGQFDSRHQQTIGIDFLARNITYNANTYRMQLWDTAGQQKFRSLVPAYLKDANCAVFVYDISRTKTFEDVSCWLDLFSQHRPYDSISLLVANKIDLKQQRKVSSQQGLRFAMEHQMGYCQVSAKEGSGVEDLFHSIIDNIHIHKKQQLHQPGSESLIQGSNTQGKFKKVNKRQVIEIKCQEDRHPCCYI